MRHGSSQLPVRNSQRSVQLQRVQRFLQGQLEGAAAQLDMLDMLMMTTQTSKNMRTHTHTSMSMVLMSMCMRAEGRCVVRCIPALFLFVVFACVVVVPCSCRCSLL
jgi:hypothetical protein